MFGRLVVVLELFWQCVRSSGRVLGMPKQALWIPGAIQGSVERCHSQRSVNAQSTLSQRYSQRSLMYTKIYQFAQTSYFFLKNNNIICF
jgi:hypothetical protein